MKTKSYLSFYYESLLNGTMQSGGLCHNLSAGISLFRPGKLSKHKDSYWGFDGEPNSFGDFPAYFNGYNGLNSSDVRFSFSPLRQNIVLFLAAMNNEL